MVIAESNLTGSDAAGYQYSSADDRTPLSDDSHCVVPDQDLTPYPGGPNSITRDPCEIRSAAPDMPVPMEIGEAPTVNSRAHAVSASYAKKIHEATPDTTSMLCISVDNLISDLENDTSSEMTGLNQNCRPYSPEMFACSQCGGVFENRHVLCRHIIEKHQQHASAPRIKFKCEQCQRSFKSMRALRNHARTHQSYFDEKFDTSAAGISISESPNVNIAEASASRTLVAIDTPEAAVSAAASSLTSGIQQLIAADTNRDMDGTFQTPKDLTRETDNSVLMTNASESMTTESTPTVPVNIGATVSIISEITTQASATTSTPRRKSKRRSGIPVPMTRCLVVEPRTLVTKPSSENDNKTIQVNNCVNDACFSMPMPVFKKHPDTPRFKSRNRPPQRVSQHIQQFVAKRSVGQSNRRNRNSPVATTTKPSTPKRKQTVTNARTITPVKNNVNPNNKNRTPVNSNTRIHSDKSKTPVTKGISSNKSTPKRLKDMVSTNKTTPVTTPKRPRAASRDSPRTPLNRMEALSNAKRTPTSCPRLPTGCQVKCIKCGKSFVDKAKLEVHFAVHIGRTPELRPVPDQARKQIKTDMPTPTRRHSLGLFKCQLCGRGYGKQAFLDAHMKIHAVNSPSKAPQTDSTVAISGSQVQAVAISTTQPSPGFSKNSPSLLSSKASPTRRTDVGIHSDVIMASASVVPLDMSATPTQSRGNNQRSETPIPLYTTPSNLEHLVPTHTESTPTLNGTPNTNVGLLNTPTRTPSSRRGTTPKRATHCCKICHKVFNYTSSLKAHLFVHRGEEVNDEATIVPDIEDNDTTTVQHERESDVTDNDDVGLTEQHDVIEHTSSTVTTCMSGSVDINIFSIPSKKTTSQTTLPNMLENDTSFACKSCDYKTNQPGELLQHLQSHSRVGPFTCTQCFKSYRIRSNLLTHEKIHSIHRLKGILISRRLSVSGILP